MIESKVLVQSLHLKHLRCHSRPFDKTNSAANTTPPQRGQPWPGGAWILAVSIAQVFGASSLFVEKKSKREWKLGITFRQNTVTDDTHTHTTHLWFGYMAIFDWIFFVKNYRNFIWKWINRKHTTKSSPPIAKNRCFDWVSSETWFKYPSADPTLAGNNT